VDIWQLAVQVTGMLSSGSVWWGWVRLWVIRTLGYILVLSDSDIGGECDVVFPFGNHIWGDRVKFASMEHTVDLPIFGDF